MGLPAMMHAIKNLPDPENHQDVIWGISNIFRTRPNPVCRDIKITIPFLCKTYKESREKESVLNAAWALGTLSETDNYIEDILNTEIVESIIDHLL